MMERNENGTTTGVRRRAAEVRRQWSLSERARRTGLPPDMPARLRAHLNDRTESNWPPAGVFQLVESRLVPLQQSLVRPKTNDGRTGIFWDGE